mmetsp:Transcript_3692/g.8083  ORF Transcript_3692/g.8083 Transcript_3692/m.8083 type:complete len:113 (-) Transcript_3692:1189-1527(-)
MPAQTPATSKANKANDHEEEEEDEEEEEVAEIVLPWQGWTQIQWDEELKKHTEESIEWFVKDAEVLSQSIVERECMNDSLQAQRSLVLLTSKLDYLRNLHQAQLRREQLPKS